jgi:Cu/Ag efflux protein CusF
LSGVLARLSQQDKAMDKGMDDVDMPMEETMNKAEGKAKADEKMPKGRGKVVDVDAKTGKVTLNHEPIKELGWPSMTMGFKVKDSNQLKKLKAGDQVEFDLKAEASDKPDMPAQYMIDRVEKAATMKDGMKGAKP